MILRSFSNVKFLGFFYYNYTKCGVKAQLFYLPQEEEQDAFIKAIQGKVTEYPTLMDGLKAQLIAEAVYQSLKTNKWVQIRYGKPE